LVVVGVVVWLFVLSKKSKSAISVSLEEEHEELEEADDGL